jgi:hypothetical protein
MKFPPVSRRQFVRTAATALITAPLIVPSRLFGATAPSSRIRVGQIGCGRIALGHDLPGVLKSGLADVVAVSDLDAKRLAHGRAWVERFYQGSNLPAPVIATYADYKELLARKDIDAVVLSLPDHQHAEVALRAVLAGKDIYLQKPFTMTYAESIVLRDAVAKSRCLMQIGSQQRSWGPHEQFRKACEFVRSGRIGRIKAVEIGLPIDPTKPDDPAQPVPPHLNYDGWLGPGALAADQHQGRTRYRFSPRLAAQREPLPRHDHGLGRPPLRHRALGHGPGIWWPAQDRGPG